ncbi:MAG: hypothetical protein LBS99_00235 [Clostridiales bacterium]|jgi:hypothetical protein|nr:hypothetical protein [Clostridiales bacterium]
MKVKYSSSPNLELENSVPMQYIENKEALDRAETLDKEDIFDHLLIPDSDYSERDYTVDGKKAKIGIEWNSKIHNSNSPILPHQQDAARHFMTRFRGVGILADEVGMGKTIEAGIVLSELAERNSIGSLLVVAENIDNWKCTLSKMFGVRGITVVRNHTDIVDNCTRTEPNRPLLMSMSDFCKLTLQPLSGICFDAVVVDEAHNFGMLDEYKRGMHVLSFMMKRKHAQNKPYCILVSGTPHNGNLNSMFPLWYFISCRGAVGDSFNENWQEINNQPSAMQAARRHYHDYLCHGANTIAEFIESWKRTMLEDSAGYPEYAAAFAAFKKHRGGADKLSKSGESKLRKDFLAGREDIREGIRQKTNEKYQALLKSFMIRQSRTRLLRQKEKRALNYYFCPIAPDADQVMTLTYGADTTRTDRNKSREIMYAVNCADYYKDRIVRYDGAEYSLDGFVDYLYNSDALRENGFSADTVHHQNKNKILFDTLDKLRAFNGSSSSLTEKSRRFYFDSFAKYNAGIDNRVELIDTDKSIFQEKAEKFVLVADERKNRRIIVFFDYYATDEERKTEPKRLYEWLERENPATFGRIIFSENYASSDAAAAAFKGKENAILLADDKLSESHNLQDCCSTVINFSICFSPIKMDQRIGRIDRIGQENTMEIVSFANMHDLEGYLLDFYNQIGLFSGWKDDIILVTGCDNANSTMKRCPECHKIILCLDDQTDCPDCSAKLQVLHNTTDYSCSRPACSFVLKRQALHDATGDYAYVCYQKGRKLTQSGSDGAEYMCNKLCVLQHCGRLNEENCQVLKKQASASPTSDINKLRMICHTCRGAKKERCDYCSMDIDAVGYDSAGAHHGGSCCKCPYKKQNCRPYSVSFAGDCPVCGSPLKANTPTTFDSFAKFIWNQDGFVDNFEFESEKIREIVETLRNTLNG